jgi:dTDP-4-dehydrorhamnose 3,5-epimerase
VFQTTDAKLQGCIKLIPKTIEDNRGISVKPFHLDSYKELKITESFDEDLIVTSKKDVLRGLHFQNPPYGQAKLVYCIKGEILDVVLDIRVGSSTYGKYELFDLSGHNNHMIYIPEGFAHGYLTLEDQSIVMYKMSSVYKPELEGGIRRDSIGIPWGIDNPIMSERDKKFLPFDELKSVFIFKH